MDSHHDDLCQYQMEMYIKPSKMLLKNKVLIILTRVINFGADASLMYTVKLEEHCNFGSLKKSPLGIMNGM